MTRPTPPARTPRRRHTAPTLADARRQVDRARAQVDAARRRVARGDDGHATLHAFEAQLARALDRLRDAQPRPADAADNLGGDAA